MTKKEKRYIEKGVDIALATDMLSLGFTKSYDVGVLVAGDLDYIKTIEALKKQGIIIEIACFKSAASGELIRCADRYIELDKIATEIKK
ncbi:MAG: NYN domain-containing protein [Candidatus Thermoplasmatota archaeon]|nr:NYN domain-containing protein [Candidatus Thermoplasmatota archaeon]